MVSLGGSVCTTCFIVVFVCGLFTVQVGNLCSHVLLFLCLYQRVRLTMIIECVRVCLCAVSPFSSSLSLYVLVWCGAATVISGAPEAQQ